MTLAVGLVFAAAGWAAQAIEEPVGPGDTAKESPTRESPEAKGTDLLVQVSDDGGNPVRGAAVSVLIDDLEIERHSDDLGQATFNDLRAGQVLVQVVASGWNSSGSIVRLTGDRMQIDLALTPRKPPAGARTTSSGEHDSQTHPLPGESAGASSHDEEETGSGIQTAVDVGRAGQPGAPAATDTDQTTRGHSDAAAAP